MALILAVTLGTLGMEIIAPQEVPQRGMFRFLCPKRARITLFDQEGM